MLIALLLSMLFGGGSIQGWIPDMEKAIREEISDKTLAKDLVQLNQEMLEEEKQFLKGLSKTLNEAGKLNRDRTVDPETMRKAFAELETMRQTRRDRIVAHLFEMRSRLSAEQWNRIYDQILSE